MWTVALLSLTNGLTLVNSVETLLLMGGALLFVLLRFVLSRIRMKGAVPELLQRTAPPSAQERGTVVASAFIPRLIREETGQSF